VSTNKRRVSHMTEHTYLISIHPHRRQQGYWLREPTTRQTYCCSNILPRNLLVLQHTATKPTTGAPTYREGPTFVRVGVTLDGLSFWTFRPHPHRAVHTHTERPTLTPDRARPLSADHIST
jgi:hypothetical protein